MENSGAITHFITPRLKAPTVGAMNENQCRLTRARFFEAPYSKSCLKLPVPLTLSFLVILSEVERSCLMCHLERFLDHA